MLGVVGRTLQWLFFDQRKLIERGFRSDDSFQVKLVLPDYAAGSAREHGRFRSRRVTFFWKPDHFSDVHRSAPTQIDVSSAYAFLKPYFGDESVFVAASEGHSAAKQAVYRTIRQHMDVQADDMMFFNYSVLERFRSGWVWRLCHADKDLSAPVRIPSRRGDALVSEADCRGFCQ